MDGQELRKRVASSAPDADLGAGVKIEAPEPHPAGKPKHGIVVEIIRLLSFVTWFVLCCVVVNFTQFVGAPLYLVNKDAYYAWMASTKGSFGVLITTITQWFSPTVIRISGDKSMDGQLSTSVDGRLVTKFADRLILIANHQLYSDWLYLWWIAYTSHQHGHIYIVLKESLKHIPVVGWGMQFFSFVFMARAWDKDKARLQHRFQKLNAKQTVTKARPDGYGPMWMLIFPEGTNLSRRTYGLSQKWSEKSSTPNTKHVLLPRSTGLQFTLEELKDSVDWVYDCTMAYEGIPEGEFGQDIFTLRATYFQGRPPKSVNLYWRRFAVSSIPVADSEAFADWLLQRWREKDELMEYYRRHGRFPADEDALADDEDLKMNGSMVETKPPRGYIETEVKLAHWWDVAAIFTTTVVTAGMFMLANGLWGYLVQWQAEKSFEQEFVQV